MHFRTLATVDTYHCFDSVSSFECIVFQKISEIMDRYSSDPINDEYIEFADETESLRYEYESNVDCLKLPNGTIVEVNDYQYFRKYSIRDGLVYQKNAGVLHNEKRTKQSRKIKALPSYPRKKVYKSFEDYAENNRGYTLDETHKAYGFYCNPNAMWDWYQIGGRWPAMFLVNSDCTEYSLGERSWCNESTAFDAPDGYMWVVAARKKDIQWETMKKWNAAKLIDRFNRLEMMFASGQLDENCSGQIVADGIVAWDGYAYYKGETLEEYLKRCDILSSRKYPVSVCDIVDDSQWLSEYDFTSDCQLEKKTPEVWHARIDEYVEGLEQNTILVGIDYHM